MADIRINALATTAASTASDDFVAVDGSANGTRKLNAYSPTFGGNLTVSGGALTLNNAAESYVELKIAGTTKGYLDQLPSTLNVLGMSGVDVDIYAGGNNPANRVAKFAASGIATTLYGNLTVSGSGGITAYSNQNTETLLTVSNPNAGSSAGSVYRLVNNVSTTNWGMRSSGAAAYFALDAGSSYIWYNGTTSLVIGATDAAGIIKFHAGGLTEQMRLFANGNLFVGASPVDSGNGKLQLATHTTSAGGIGFGTGLSLFTSSASVLDLSVASGNPTLRFLNGTTVRGGIGTSGTTLTVQSDGGSVILASNSTTALTLDSSQNATFAGRVTINGTGTGASLVNGLQLNGGGSSGTNNNLDAINWGGGGLSWLRIYGIRDAGGGFGGTQYFQTMNGSGTLTTALTLDASQNATFAGTVIANKATTAFRIPTAETPASASATGTVGTITWDASYIYVCTAANTWKRVAIATWP